MTDSSNDGKLNASAVEFRMPSNLSRASPAAQLPPHAHELWFPECRDCSCCAGMKHGCACCAGSVNTCAYCLIVPPAAGIARDVSDPDVTIVAPAGASLPPRGSPFGAPGQSSNYGSYSQSNLSNQGHGSGAGAAPHYGGGSGYYEPQPTPFYNSYGAGAPQMMRARSHNGTATDYSEQGAPQLNRPHSYTGYPPEYAGDYGEDQYYENQYYQGPYFEEPYYEEPYYEAGYDEPYYDDLDQDSSSKSGPDEVDFIMSELEAELELDLNRKLNIKDPAPVSKQSSNLPAHAHELWFPECRDCSCCAGMKHGCACCAGSVNTCTHCSGLVDVVPPPVPNSNAAAIPVPALSRELSDSDVVVIPPSSFGQPASVATVGQPVANSSGNSRKAPCSFFRGGFCKNGNACAFYH